MRTKITLLSLAVLLLLSTAEALDRRELLGAKNNKKNGKKTHALNPRPSFPPGDARGKFEDFKRKFGRSYASPEEEAKRYAEFMKVEQLLQDLLNSTDGKAQFGHNHFSDRTHEERQALNGVTSPSSPPPAPLGRRALSAAEDAASAEVVAAAGVGRDLLQTYPATVDWSSYFPPVTESQGNCGSCYAFSIAAALTAQINIAYKRAPAGPSMSEEFILECGVAQGTGCTGADPPAVVQQLFDTYGGVWPDYARPYTQAANSMGSGVAAPACPAPARNNRTLGTGTYPWGTGFWTSKTNTYAGTEAYLMQLLQSGPVVIAILAEDAMFFYKSGVYGKDCTNRDSKQPGPITAGMVNHAVVAVGYGTDPVLGPFWKIRNSWGATWGENGYGRIKRNAYGTATWATGGGPSGGFCGMALRPTLINIAVTAATKSPPPGPPPRPNPPPPPIIGALRPGFSNVPCSTANVSLVYLAACKNYPALCGTFLLDPTKTCPGSAAGSSTPVFALTPTPAAYSASRPLLWFAASATTWVVGQQSDLCKAVALGAPTYVSPGGASAALASVAGAVWTDSAVGFCGVPSSQLVGTPPVGR